MSMSCMSTFGRVYSVFPGIDAGRVMDGRTCGLGPTSKVLVDSLVTKGCG